MTIRNTVVPTGTSASSSSSLSTGLCHRTFSVVCVTALLAGLSAGKLVAQDMTTFANSFAPDAALNNSGLCDRKVRSEEGGTTHYGLPKHIYNAKFMWENDVGISDRDYTNGMKWERYLYPGCLFGLGRVGFTAAWLHDAIPDGPHKGQKTYPSLGYAIGMNFYTPGDLEEPMLQPEDRPYSGWLYGSLISERQYTEDTSPADEPSPVAGSAKLETMLGVLGKWAQQDHVQESFHSLIDATDPQGWDNQQSGTVGFNIAYERKHYSYAGKDHVQFSYGYGANLGNVRTDVSGSLGVAFTFNPDSWAYLDTATIGPTKRSVAAAQNFEPSERNKLSPEETQAASATKFPAERATL